MPDPIVLDPERLARFWSRVTKTETCWLFTPTRPLGHDGYPAMCYALNTTAPVNRISWMIHYGPIPDGLYVLHACDVKACVRPSHLFLGTQSDNIQDYLAKGHHLRDRRARWRQPVP